MMKSLLKSIFLLVLTVVSQVNLAQANLLVSPTRLSFDDRERSQELVLINTDSKVRTYRLHWVEKVALSTGGYKELTAQEAMTHPMASKMIRFSPKQVTLKPNERQVVRLALRRPKGLLEGEYRSHLKLEALPPKKDVGKNKSEMSIRLDVLLSYSLPVVVRQGDVSHDIKISGHQLVFDRVNNKTQLRVDFARSGQFSSSGNVVAYWTGLDGNEHVVARLNNLNLYPELRTASQPLSWVDDNFRPSQGKLRLIYEGAQEFKGQIFAEREFSVTPDMFKAEF